MFLTFTNVMYNTSPSHTYIQTFAGNIPTVFSYAFKSDVGPTLKSCTMYIIEAMPKKFSTNALAIVLDKVYSTIAKAISMPDVKRLLNHIMADIAMDADITFKAIFDASSEVMRTMTLPKSALPT